MSEVGTIGEWMVLVDTYVNKLKYNAVTTPYRCLVHSVRMKPSGHFFLMIGPKNANIMSGSDEERAYTTSP